MRGFYFARGNAGSVDFYEFLSEYLSRGAPSNYRSNLQAGITIDPKVPASLHSPQGDV